MVMEHQGNKYEVVIQGNMAKMRKDGRRFRDLVLPQGEAWDNSNQRNRLLMAWCGLIATTGG